MNIYRCQIELHDSLYFATREIGRLYETEPILHNYALCYALGLVDNPIYNTQVKSDFEYRYFCASQIPQYEAHLTKLNEQVIYVTPARSVNHTAVLNTWKYANNNYHVEMAKTQKNIPSFGRNKEIAPESIFECFIISKSALTLPKWIRLGKWMSKAEVSLSKLVVSKTKTGVFNCSYPLNPLDVMFTNHVISYDVINMPPVSLIRNVVLQGEYYELKDEPNNQGNFKSSGNKLILPVRMKYRFS
jgi:CRISPR-associated protein Csc1